MENQRERVESMPMLQVAKMLILIAILGTYIAMQ